MVNLHLNKLSCLPDLCFIVVLSRRGPNSQHDIIMRPRFLSCIFMKGSNYTVRNCLALQSCIVNWYLYEEVLIDLKKLSCIPGFCCTVLFSWRGPISLKEIVLHSDFCCKVVFSWRGPYSSTKIVLHCGFLL